MQRRLADMFRAFRSINEESSSALRDVSKLKPQIVGEARFAVRSGRAQVVRERIAIGSQSCNVPRFEPMTGDEEEQKEIASWNDGLRAAAYARLFRDVAPRAEQEFVGMIAPGVEGIDHIKRAAAWLLAADEPVHVLMLGDPSTGKTRVLRSVDALAPVSSFGLGSGSSKAGLTVAGSGKTLVKGLLPLADGGVCCIDELNLMRKEDRAGLLTAMESGIVAYDKAGAHVELPARVSILASANPKGDRFSAATVDAVRKQLPFDAALLSRFHIMFVVLRPGAEEFARIARGIVRTGGVGQEATAAKGYLEHIRKMQVVFPASLENVLAKSMEDLRREEHVFVRDVTPRMVVGVVRLAKARARLHGRRAVGREDVDAVISVVRAAMQVQER